MQNRFSTFLEYLISASDCLLSTVTVLMEGSDSSEEVGWLKIKHMKKKETYSVDYSVDIQIYMMF